MKVSNIIKRVEADGWYQVNHEGSHRQYRHPKKPGRVTIAGKLGDEPPTGTVKSIFRQAQLTQTVQ